MWVREILDLNQAALARVMGLDASILNRIERGERPPSVFFVIAFANRFDLSADYILRGKLTGRENPELQLELAARHPELILGRDDLKTDKDRFLAACMAQS